MKTTKKIVQWIVFVVAVLGTFMGLVLVFSLMTDQLIPVIGAFAALSLMLILMLGAGALWSYLSAVVWLWLAERGWFM